MEEYKIKNFNSAYPDKAFPFFEAITAERLKDVQGELKKSFSCSDIDLEVIKRIRKQALHVGYAEDDQIFDVLKKHNIASLEKVIINWHRFDELDEMVLADLDTFFDDIWYPPSDDIDIFDESFSWVLSIDHDGSMFLWKRPE